MRVTSSMKEHIETLVKERFADEVRLADEAADKAENENNKKINRVREYALTLVDDATAKVAAFAAKQGLTWRPEIPDCDWRGAIKKPNKAFAATIGDGDFEETNTGDNPAVLKYNEIKSKPQKVREAIRKMANAIVFGLEVGDVKKNEIAAEVAALKLEVK